MVSQVSSGLTNSISEALFKNNIYVECAFYSCSFVCILDAAFMFSGFILISDAWNELGDRADAVIAHYCVDR